MTPQLILNAYRWSNGNVMTFDSFGRRVPHLHGRYEDVRADVLNVAPECVLFYHIEWGGPSRRVSREEW